MKPFEQVVADHSVTVLRVCRAIAGPDLADDAWSETFLAALTAYPRLPADANVTAWLVTIARRKCLDLFRCTARQIPTHPLPERPSTDPEIGGWTRDLHEALGELTDRQRTAVVGHHLAGLPYPEVADLLGCTPAAARRAGADGIARLRTIYKDMP
ncbi:MAG TPA: RNA polymerase sigma factor [Ruania sp.]|nr:RNA polymerase sigma factor [Ruania sp.]